MKSISSQHDKYFKSLFSHKEEMTDFVVHALPQLAKNIDTTTLQLDTTQYIDKRLEIGYSDIVYNCKYKNKIDIKIALLFEHKSEKEDYPHLQLLGYMLKIWFTNIKQGQPLMPIVPILFYHGKEDWVYEKFANSFEDLDDLLLKYILEFDFEFINTKHFTDQQIDQMFDLHTLKMGVLLMKHIFDDNLIDELNVVFGNLTQVLNNPNGKQLFETTLIYLYSNLKNDKNKVTEQLNKISTMGAQIAKTIAEQLHEEGMLHGLEEGIRQVAINMIRNNFDNQTIMLATKLSENQINILRNLEEFENE